MAGTNMISGNNIEKSSSPRPTVKLSALPEAVPAVCNLLLGTPALPHSQKPEVKPARCPNASSWQIVSDPVLLLSFRTYPLVAGSHIVLVCPDTSIFEFS